MKRQLLLMPHCGYMQEYGSSIVQTRGKLGFIEK